MKIGLGAFNLSRSVFLNKVTRDLEVGVRVKTGVRDKKDVVRVWTDTRGWQFSLVGLVKKDHSLDVEKLEIQSFGNSAKYMKLFLSISNLRMALNIQKLSPNFAELSVVTVNEAQDFIEGYMQSTVNRTLTEKLFADYTSSEEKFAWLQI